MTKNHYPTKDFRLFDLDLNRKLSLIVHDHYHQLSPRGAEIARLVFMRFKRYSDSEYHLFLVMAYALVYFDVMPLNHPILAEEDREAIRKLLLTFEYEMTGERDKYIDSMLALNEDLLLVKILIKYTVLLAEEEYGEFIPHKIEYYRSLGWLIPVLSYRNYEIIAGFLQDVYFKKFYPLEYEWTNKLRQIPKVSDYTESYMVDITNDMASIMQNLGIFGIVKLRKKSLFSIYNKLASKKPKKIYDIVGMRIILANECDVERFAQEIEKRFIVEVKKDYIRKPKENGYRGMHYAFLYTHRNCETEIELQIRTKEMNDTIGKQDYLTHFAYSYSHDKWSPLFKEVRE